MRRPTDSIELWMSTLTSNVSSSSLAGSPSVSVGDWNSALEVSAADYRSGRSLFGGMTVDSLGTSVRLTMDELNQRWGLSCRILGCTLAISAACLYCCPLIDTELSTAHSYTVLPFFVSSELGQITVIKLRYGVHSKFMESSQRHPALL